MSCFRSSSRSIQPLTLVAATGALLAILGTPVAANGQSQDVAAAPLTIEVDTPRPLSAAIRELSARHGWVITYEDPRWAHESDVDDETDRYPEAARKAATGELPHRLLRPRSKRLELSYRMLEVATGQNGEPLVSRLVREAAEGFEVREQSGLLHVVPTDNLDAEGRFVPHVSPFDLTLQVPVERRTIDDTIRAILDAVNRVSDTPVSWGMVMIGPFDRASVQIGSEGDRTARELLVEAMRLDDLKTSWLMLYDPGLQKYFFSVYPVRAPTMPSGP